MNIVWLSVLLLDPATSDDHPYSPCELYSPAKDDGALTIAGVVFQPADLLSVAQGRDQYFDEEIITLTFSEAGNKKFVQLQKNRIGKPLPICFGRNVIIDPILHELVLGGQVQLSGNVDDELYRRIDAYLRTGTNR